MKKFYLAAMLASLVFVGDISAQGRRNRNYQQQPQSYQQPVEQKRSVSADFKGEICEDALKEVNEARAKRGLKPYIYDPLLAQGALACAKYRAERFMAGHTSNDFSFLPTGAMATVGGCAGLEPSWGFQACAMFDNYTYCGAASVMGSDGKRYCQLFAR